MFPDITPGRKPIGGKSVLILHSLNDMECLRETARRPGVIKMKMRKQYVRNARWIDSDARQLIHTLLFFSHYRIIDVRNPAPMSIGIADAFSGVATVNHDVSFRMLNEKPWDGNFIRFV